jgi:hypothetical protein
MLYRQNIALVLTEIEKFTLVSVQYTLTNQPRNSQIDRTYPWHFHEKLATSLRLMRPGGEVMKVSSAVYISQRVALSEDVDDKLFHALRSSCARIITGVHLRLASALVCA